MIVTDKQYMVAKVYHDAAVFTPGVHASLGSAEKAAENLVHTSVGCVAVYELVEVARFTAEVKRTPTA